MRGGSQAHLVEAADGHFYVVKFSNNPQSRRILINEWMASAILRNLGIATPEVAAINISGQFLAQNPDAYLELKSGRQSIEPGWHFGSRFPGPPGVSGVYDFVPDSLFAKVANITDFRGVLAFDKWLGNEDARQCIFFRAALEPLLQLQTTRGSQMGLVVQMIDHGGVFHGADWCFGASPIQGLYFRPIVYCGVHGFEDFEPWLTRIVNFPDHILIQAARELPRSWLKNEERALEALLAGLLRRRKSVPELISCAREDPANPFPNWQ
jgi:hypothetical protein